MAWAYGVHPPALANGRSTTKRRKNWKANEGPSCLVHYHSSRITRHGFCHRSPMEYLTSVVFIPKTLAEIGHESGSVSGAQAHPVVLIDHALGEIGFIASKPQFLVVSRKRALPWGMVAFPQKRGEGRSGKRPATRSFFAEPKGLIKAPLAAHAGGRPATAADQGTEAADQGRGAGEAGMLGVGPGEGETFGEEIARVCRNAVGKLPCSWTHL